MRPDPLEANPAPQWTRPEFRPEAAAPRGPRLKPRGPAGLLSSLILVALTLALFLGTKNHDFVNYDDDVYVLENPMVNGGLRLEGIGLAFRTQHSANWHPLTWISHALDVELYGLAPAGHHLSSVLLHCLVALLLLRLLLLLFDDRWLAIGAALLWAVHPLRVESVAWVSERKDLLSGLFAMLTLIGYVGWTYFPSRPRKAWVAISFACGLMAKPMLVSLPLILLLLDAWPLGRLSKSNWKPRLLEKAPLFAMALAAVVLTILTQSAEGAISGSDKLSLLTRLENAQLSLYIYLEQFLYPSSLSVLYPHLINTQSDAQSALFWPALGSMLLYVALAGLAILKRKSAPWLGLGLLWFVLMLLPVLGLVQVGYHAHADRYTYLPSIGLALIAGSLFKLGMSKRPRLALAALGLALALLSAKTWRQVGVWENSIQLWENALSVDRVNLVAHKNLALALAEVGEFERALEHFGLAHQMDPADATLLNQIGEWNLELLDLQAAAAAFERAQAADPSDWTYALNRGLILMRLGQAEQASTALDAAEALGCDDYRLPLARGALAIASGQAASAEAHMRAALERCTGILEELECLEALGALQTASQQLEQAILTYQRMLMLDPGDVFGHYNLGNALERAGQNVAAQQSFARALELDPSFQAAMERMTKLKSNP